MDTELFYRELESLLQDGKLDEIEPFLTSMLEKAKKEEDYASHIVIGNEMVSYYRNVSRFQNAFDMAEDVLLLLEELNMDGSEHFASTLINAASAYREADQLEQAYKYYVQALHIYDGLLPKGDCRFAVLYSDMGMLLMQMGETQKAGPLFEEAVALFETAEIKENMEMSYSAALTGLGEASYHMGDFEKALFFYEKARTEVKEHFGEGESYAVLCRNCEAVRSCLKKEDGTGK